MAENDLFSTGGRLLPTPRTNDHTGPGEHGRGGRDLRTEISLLPTPDSYAADRGGAQDPAKRRAGGHTVSHADVAVFSLATENSQSEGTGAAAKSAPTVETFVRELRAAVRTCHPRLEVVPDHTGDGSDRLGPSDLVPTPSVADALGGHQTRGGARKDELLLGGLAKYGHLSRFGPYAPAIRRWEHVLGRFAPAPTTMSKSGGQQLSAIFVEFLMGVPLGWVSDAVGPQT